jgi:hypothetical protein
MVALHQAICYLADRFSLPFTLIAWTVGLAREETSFMGAGFRYLRSSAGLAKVNAVPILVTFLAFAAVT